MAAPSIEDTIKYVQSLIQRNLSGEEIFLIGVAFQQGILRGIEEAQKKD